MVKLMDVQITEASVEQKPILDQLMQLYMHDFSEYTDEDVDQNGIFTYHFFDEYWNESGRYPFLVHCDGKLAGFVLVNAHTFVLEQGAGKSIAEFFVMRKYRRKGVGRQVAFYIFDRFPGRWEIRQNAPNVAGQQFWRTIIAEYTQGKFSETVLDSPWWARGPVQTFDNSPGV